MTPALAGGALRVLGGALTHFPCKLRLKKIFFTALGDAGARTAPPGYAYAPLSLVSSTVVRLVSAVFP